MDGSSDKLCIVLVGEDFATTATLHGRSNLLSTGVEVETTSFAEVAAGTVNVASDEIDTGINILGPCCVSCPSSEYLGQLRGFD